MRISVCLLAALNHGSACTSEQTSEDLSLCSFRFMMRCFWISFSSRNQSSRETLLVIKKESHYWPTEYVFTYFKCLFSLIKVNLEKLNQQRNVVVFETADGRISSKMISCSSTIAPWREGCWFDSRWGLPVCLFYVL